MVFSEMCYVALSYPETQYTFSKIYNSTGFTNRLDPHIILLWSNALLWAAGAGRSRAVTESNH